MTREAASVLAFDVGGSYVKAGLVQPETGTVAGQVLRWPTPDGASPVDVIEQLAQMSRELPSTGPVGLAFPAVAKRGVAWTAANVDARWIGTNAQAPMLLMTSDPDTRCSQRASAS